MKNFKQLTIEGIKWSGISHVFSQIFQFAISVILARILTPKDFGMIGMILVFTNFAELFSELGLGAAIIQKPNISQRHLSSIFWINVFIGFVIAILLYFFSPAISDFFSEPKLEILIIVLSSTFIISSFKITPNGLLKKNLEFKALAKVQIFAITVSGSFAVVLALNQFGVWSLVIKSIVYSAVSTISIWIFIRWRPKFFFGIAFIKDIFKFSANLFGFNILNYWARNFDNLLIGRFIGSSALGIYSRAYSLMLLPISQFSAVLGKVMFPAFSIIQKDRARVKSVYLKYTRAISLISFPTMLGLLVTSESFILGIYGHKWVEVIPILQIFCVTGMLHSITTTVGSLYNSLGRTDIQFKWGLFAGFVRVISFTIGLQWGIIGIALAFVITDFCILWYPAWTIPGRLINLKFSEMIKNMSGTFVCSLTMSVAVFIYGYFTSGIIPKLINLFIQINLGIVIYLALIHVCKIKAYQELKEILKEEIMRKSVKNKKIRGNGIN